MAGPIFLQGINRMPCVTHIPGDYSEDFEEGSESNEDNKAEQVLVTEAKVSVLEKQNHFMF